MMLLLRWGNPTVGAGGELVLQFGYTTAPGDDRADLPLLNLALVIDRSGSMAAANKLTQVKAALGAFVGRLRPEDRVALITYNGEQDCNENNVADACDIANGTSDDANGNGVPDECESGCTYDLDGDGDVDVDDILALINGFGSIYDVDDLLGAIAEFGCS